VSVAIEPRFTETEAKLLRLLLCPIAAVGEVDAAGHALIASWRRRGLLAETLLEPSTKSLPPSRSGFSPADMLMPFGKHRGRPLRQIRRSYLRWILDNCDQLQPELNRAIVAMLDGNWS